MANYLCLYRLNPNLTKIKLAFESDRNRSLNLSDFGFVKN